MNTALLSTIFCPLLQLSPKLFSNFVEFADEFFPNTILTRYVSLIFFFWRMISHEYNSGNT